MTGRKWTKRAAVLLAVLAGVGAWAAANEARLRARYAAHQLTAAPTDADRARWADDLAARGAPGFDRLIEFVKSGDDRARAASLAALEKHLSALPENDPRAVTIGGSILSAYPGAQDPGKKTILALAPTILKRTGGTHADRCRAVVADALKLPDPTARLAAVRLAIHPDIRLRTEVVPLLAAREPEVRGASLFAVTAGPDGDQLLADDELFRWLHDPDAGVRKVCHDALVSRDRTDAEISLGQRLSHPDPTERLKLLLDLRYDEVADPEPWLERLSRDVEPAVRAGAARVMVEVATGRKQPCPAWVARVSDADAHPTVRFIAGYYRRLPVAAPAGGP
ncbi:MAG: hypothetical protein ACKODX_05755 [Gemmata sp.]